MALKPHVTDVTTTSRVITVRQEKVRVSILLKNEKVQKIFFEAEQLVGKVVMWKSTEMTNTTIDDLLSVLSEAKGKLGEH